MQKYIKEFMSKKTETLFRKALVFKLDEYEKENTLAAINKLINNMSKHLFASGKTFIEDFNILTNDCDYGLKNKIGISIKADKGNKKTINRFLVYIGLKIDLFLYENEKLKELCDKNREEIAGLASGKLVFVKCANCKGKGWIEDKDSEDMINCYVCDGIGKTIEKSHKGK
jgi:hypothetical protein